MSSCCARLVKLLCAICCLAVPAAAAGESIHPVAIPLTFEQNRGQADGGVRFLAHAGRDAIGLSDDEITLASTEDHSGRSVRMRFLSAAAGPASREVTGESPTGGFANYYGSNDPKKWLSHVPLFSRVRYSKVYPGIDAVFRGHGDQLEFDFEVAPGSSPDKIALGVEGADRILPTADGGLDVIAGDVHWHLLVPVAYQLRGGKREPVTARYQISDDRRVRFGIGKFDPLLDLVIDPVVVFANAIPSGDLMVAAALQIDSMGNPIIAGVSGAQATIVKLDPGGDTILYASHIGTSNILGGDTYVRGLALDSNGNAYLAGFTMANDFPITNNLGSCPGPGSCDTGYVAKFATDGSLVYSTFIGSGSELPQAIAVDATGAAYITGSTNDDLLPTVNAYQPSAAEVGCEGCSIAFFAKLDPLGASFAFASYFYGDDPQSMEMAGEAVALDGDGNIYLAGSTDNSWPPFVNPWQTGVGSYFLAEFAPDGQTLRFSTLFGSSAGISPVTFVGMAIGTDGTIHIAGTTGPGDFPYSINGPAIQYLPPIENGSGQIFAMAVDSTLTKLIYSDYLGNGYVTSMALDSANHLHIGGAQEYSLPLQNPVDSASAGGFLIDIDPSGNLLNVSQLGGHFISEIPGAMAADASGNLYVATQGTRTGQTNFPTQYMPLDPLTTVGPILPGTPGSYFAKISPASGAQISLTTTAPFLMLRDVGSADLHISNITFNAAGGGGQINGNCGSTVPAGGDCAVTVTGPSGLVTTGTVSITSDAAPSAQTFTIQAPMCGSSCKIGDQLWLQDLPGYRPPQLTGTQTASVPITIWNVGVANASLNSVQAMGGDLYATSDCGPPGAILAPGTNCTAQVSYTPGGSLGWLQVLYDGTSSLDLYDTNIFPLAITAEAVALSARSLNFGTQTVEGVAFPRVVSVTNSSNNAVPVSTVSIQGDPEFVVSGNTCTAALAPHTTCVVGVQFLPDVDGTPTATLNIAGGTVTLRGQGQIGSIVSVSPLELDFPETIIGYAANVETLTLTNASASSLAVNGISFSLPDYSETDTCAGQVPANGSCTVSVTFIPQQLNQRDGTMTISFPLGVPGQILTVTGSGVTPMNATPTSLTFGAIEPGATSSSQVLSIGNGMKASAQVYSLAITGDFGIAQNPCPNPMPGIYGCVLLIEFQPQNPGIEQGTLTISYPGIPEQTVVTLTGGSNMEPNISVPSTLNFGNQSLTSTGMQSLTITNTGLANLTISGAAISGINASDFAVATGQCSTITPGASCAFQASFTPPALGQFSAALAISSNAYTAPRNVSLQGNGASSFALQVPSLTANVARGGTATYQLTPTPTTGFTGIVQFTCSGLPQYATCAVQPASIDFSKVSNANVVVTVSTSTPVTASMVLQSMNVVAAILCLPLFLLGRRVRGVRLTMLFLLVAISLGCGGAATPASSTTTPQTFTTAAGSYTFSVTAISPIDSETVQLSLVVTQ